MKIAYLTPKSSFRENLRSDTLWGLLCWGIKTVFSEEDLTNFLSEYNNGNGLKISSTFRFFDIEKKRIHFFPKPILKPIDLNEYFDNEKITEKADKAEVIRLMKLYKKIKFIEKENFEKFLSGEFNESSFFKSEKWKDTLPSFKREDVLHNQINRLTNTTEKGALYTTTEFFSENGVLFFLFDGNESQIKLISGVLNFFSHIGFGGDSSIGKNHFDISIEDFSFKNIQDPNAFVSLSLFSPKPNEITEFKRSKSKFWYELEARKGKFGGQFIKAKNFWKDSVLYFKEGSVFPHLNSVNYGRNIKVMKGNEFDVYQYGFAFNLPIKIEEKL